MPVGFACIFPMLERRRRSLLTGSLMYLAFSKSLFNANLSLTRSTLLAIEELERALVSGVLYFPST